MKIKSFKLNTRTGFTFIEFIVVISIFSALSTVILFNSGNFTSNINLQNLSNQIALLIKKAQTQATSGLGGTGAAGLFGSSKPSYGVHFNSATPSEFTYFADLDNDGEYDSGICNNPYQGLSECVDKITIQTGDRINTLFATCDASNLNITFKRPFPDAAFYTENGPEPIARVGVGIISPKTNLQKTIIISTTGQIEIKNGSTSDNGFSGGSCI